LQLKYFNMSITKASIADAAELTALVNSAYRGETSKLGWTSESHLLDGIRIDEPTFTNYLEDHNIIILKNYNSEGLITACVYLEQRNDKLYLGMLTVSPTEQGKGIGKELLIHAEHYAKRLGCKAIQITVITSRHELIAWYERNGYKATGEVLPFPKDEKFGRPKTFIELMVMEKPVL